MPDNALLAFQTQLLTGPVMEEEKAADGVYLKAPTAPGFGIEVDPEMAEKCRVGD